ncbi:unnamed protein product [Schistocephalus solidus]|uniref:AF4/FMR2 family member 2 n=1 Tax=Schistocephalus solidus TaxID=70667 RepID=A0A183T3G5_SCHSO|nr:unnamed protein product [Schistocephalus solidus]
MDVRLCDSDVVRGVLYLEVLDVPVGPSVLCFDKSSFYIRISSRYLLMLMFLLLSRMDHKHPSPVASPQASGCFASPTVVGNFLDFMLPKAQSTAIKSVNQKSSSPLCGAATYTVITNQSLSVHGKDLSVQRLNLSACLLEYSTSSGAVEDQQLQQKLANSIPPEASADHGGNGKGISLEEQEAVEHAVHLNDEELRHLEEAFEDFSQDTTAATCQPPSSKNVQSADTCGLLRSPPSVATPVFDSPDATMASSIPSLNESSSSKQSVVDAETRCCVLSEINANVPNSPSCPKSYKENQPSLPTTAKFLSEEEEDRENQPPNTTSSKPVRIPEAQEDSFSPNLSDPIYRRQLSTILECQSKESLGRFWSPEEADVESLISCLFPAADREVVPDDEGDAGVTSLRLWPATPDEDVAGTHFLHLTVLSESGFAESSHVHFLAHQFSSDKRRSLFRPLAPWILAVKSSSSNPPDASETVQRSAVFNNDFPDANTTSSSLPTEALAPADLPLLSLPRTPPRLAYWPVSPPSAEDLQVNLSAPEVLIVSPSAALPLTTQVTVSCRRPLGEITLDGLAVHVSLKPAEAHFNLPIRLPSALQPDSLCLLPSRLSTPLTFHAQLAIESDGASTVPKEGFACDLLVTAHVYSTAKPVRSLSSTSKCVRLRCEGLQKVNRAGDIEETETVNTASVCTEDEMPAAPPEDNDSTADPEPSAATPHYSDLSPPGVASAPVTPEVGVIADDSSAARMEEPSTDEAPIRAVDKNPRLLSSSQPPPSLGKRSDTTASLFATTKCLFWPASSYDSSRSQYLILKHKFPGVVRIRLEITSGSDVFMLLNDRGLPSKGGRLIELPAELQCTIGVVYSPLPGQQWHFGELQLRVDTPSRVHSKVRLIGYAESSKIDIYCCKRVDENTFWSVAFPCHPPRMDLPSPGDHRSSGSVIATEPAWVTRVVVSNWGQRTAWVLVRYSPWKEETVKSTAAAATDVTTELQAPRLTVKPDRFFLAPNQIVNRPFDIVPFAPANYEIGSSSVKRKSDYRYLRQQELLAPGFYDSESIV